ncbi:hypothetical protein SNM64_24665, partial [Klebsiella pneumoniae]
QTETEATGAPQKHHYTLNQQVGSITPTLSTHGHVNQRPDAVNKKFIGGNDNNHNVFPYTLLL